MSREAEVVQVRFREASDEYPLAVGGAFLAAGLLAGLLLARTEREDEFMGEYSDEVKDETRAMAEELVERGKNVAVRAASSAMDEAKARGLTPGELADKAGRVASEAVRAGKEKAHEENISASDLKKHTKAIGEAAKKTASDEGEREALQ